MVVYELREAVGEFLGTRPQSFAVAHFDRGDGEMQGVDEIGVEEGPDRGDAAADADVLATGGLQCLRQGFLMAQLGAWGARWLDTTPELTVLAEGGPALWERFMDELRAVHLRGAPRPTDGGLSEPTAAYDAAVRREQQSTG